MLSIPDLTVCNSTYREFKHMLGRNVCTLTVKNKKNKIKQQFICSNSLCFLYIYIVCN